MEKINFEITEPDTPLMSGSDSQSSDNLNKLSSFFDTDQKLPLTVWINDGPMENFMYRKKESFLSKDSIIDKNDEQKTDTESVASFHYTYPVDKVRIRDFIQIIIQYFAKKRK
jgi:hypothetical protein